MNREKQTCDRCGYETNTIDGINSNTIQIDVKGRRMIVELTRYLNTCSSCQSYLWEILTDFMDCSPEDFKQLRDKEQKS